MNKNDCMEPRYVNRDEPRQYKCITINHKCNGFAREIRKIQYEMQRLEYYINTLEEE